MSNDSGSGYTTGKAKTEGASRRGTAGADNKSGTEFTKKAGTHHPPVHSHPSAPGNAYHPNGEHTADGGPATPC